MHAKTFSATTIGINAHRVDVEVDLSYGLVNFHIVGLPDKAIKESKDRIRAALKNSGLAMPQRLITVNLAPASLKKEDILFDVPIAIAILQASNALSMPDSFIEETVFLGELSLDGAIRPVRGILSIAHNAQQAGKKRLIVPKQNVYEASLIEGLEIIGVETLCELVSYLRNEKAIAPAPATFENFKGAIKTHPLDFDEVKGQWQAKRALQIAAAGRHNILFIGPPGSGKTMLARRLATILPPMAFDEVIEATKIYSVAGLLKSQSLIVHRPFRAPHHTISKAGLVGGGTHPRPGEISLAHNGVLFLDELTEFSRATLEVLRQPLEEKEVLISRANMSVDYPASFLLVAALNPCPCGYFGDKSNRCTCHEQQIKKYLGKLSGPMLDRIDLHVPVLSIEYKELQARGAKEQSSKEMFMSVQGAIAFREKRSSVPNAYLSSSEVEQFCKLSDEATRVLKMAFDKLALSMRGYHKILKIARTIADFEQSMLIERAHIQEAILYRSLEQGGDS